MLCVLLPISHLGTQARVAAAILNAFKVKEDSGVSHMDISMPGPEVTCVVSAQNLLAPFNRRDPALPQA